MGFHSIHPVKKTLAVVCLCGLFLFSFTHCVTRVSYHRLRPSEINLAPYKQLMVCVFQSPAAPYSASVPSQYYLNARLNRSEYDLKVTLVHSVSNLLIQQLEQTGFFEMVVPDESQLTFNLSRLNRLSIPEIAAYFGADAVIMVNLSTIDWDDRSFRETRTRSDAEGNSIAYQVAMVERSIRLNLQYSVVDTGTRSVIATRNFSRSYEGAQPESERELLPDPETHLTRLAGSLIPKIVRQLAPYTVRETASLARDHSKNPLMKQAEEAVRAGLIEDALPLFLEIWETTRNPAAAYDLSVLYESKQNYTEAIRIINEAIQWSPTKAMYRQKKRLEGLMAEAAEVALHF